MWRRLLSNSFKVTLLSTAFISPIVFSKEQLYAWVTFSSIKGWNNFGQLGLGHSNNVNIPQPVPVDDIVFIACRSNISAAIDKAGRLYTWGRSRFGLLGNGYSDTCNQPTLVESLKGIEFKFVACGNNHMAAITKSGELYTWGNGDHGKLCHSYNDKERLPSREKYAFNRDVGNAKLPQKVELDFKVRHVSLGDQFTLLVSENGDVYSIGANKKGILGVDNGSDATLTKIEGLQNVLKVDSGTDFSIALDQSGNLHGWGSNYFGQLGQPSPMIFNRPQKIKLPAISDFSCGDQFVAALDTSGGLYAWGMGSDGQLGQQGKQDIPTPHKVEFQHPIQKVSCGQAHVGLLASQTLYMMGRAKEGQLGRGNFAEPPTSSKTIPQPVHQNVISFTCGGSHSFAVVNVQQ